MSGKNNIFPISRVVRSFPIVTSVQNNDDDNGYDNDSDNDINISINDNDVSRAIANSFLVISHSFFE